MYILIQDNKLTGFSDKPFVGYTKVIPISYEEYMKDPEKWILENGELVLNPQIAKVREQRFKDEFFFIPSFGWFRRVPKGYRSANEALSTAFNIVVANGFLPENTLTFYNAPDFTNESQCSEDWLVANAFKNKKMTNEEFGIFYADFVVTWNNEEHK
jgi:hypothetical protein